MESKERNILEQSRLLIFKFGVKSLTMDDIAQHLRISKKTLYQYYENKNDLVNKVIDLTIEEFESNDCEQDYHNMNSIEVLINRLNFIVKMLKHVNPVLDFELKKYYPESFSRMEEFRTRKISKQVKINIIKGMEEGLYRKDLNPELFSHLFLAQMSKIMDGETFPKDQYLMPTLVKDFHIYHIRGIATSKGIEVLENLLATQLFDLQNGDEHTPFVYPQR